MSIFSSVLVRDHATGRGIANRAVVVTSTTSDAPLEVLDLDGNPTQLVTNAYGYTPDFQVAGVQKVFVRAGRTRVVALAIDAPEGGGSGVTDHGDLSGLGDDDHPQYHTDARGDARYQPLGNYASAAQGTKADNAVQPDALADVATSGSYDDLIDKPAAPVQRVPDPTGQADGRVLVVSSDALVYGDAPSGGGGGPLTGTGFPEGVVTAPPGATYFDTAQTMGAALWRKYTGTGNTGWRVEQGDTGWRDVLADLQLADPSMTAASGWWGQYVRRVNDRIEYSIGVNVTESYADWGPALGRTTIGWRTEVVGNWQIPASVTGSAGILHLSYSVKPWRTGVYFFHMTFAAETPWPTTYIGTPR